MASIYDIKPAFQSLLRPITRGLAGAGITANQVTLGAMFGSFGVALLLYVYPLARWSLLLVPAWFFLRMALNAIDGMLAREHGMKSSLGAVLNELSDVASDAALYLAFARVSGFSAPLVVAVVVLAIISEMTGVVAVQIGASRRYDGPMGKSDRAFVFGAAALVLGLGVPGGLWQTILLVALIVLLVVTILNRARRALLEVKPAR